ncbi:LysE family translocator [Motilimonas cestriensis]|uniref:LysE family translocator n=1 Tax=Motilimonas cestriensis TaxID=2742685 RepID=A0ABS8W8Y9_9GAMM|nr:LysE family translocator [Motilimonas cestriensis]MCE2594026.1 LysE family translocator [Motilimonas cestriensis]
MPLELWFTLFLICCLGAASPGPSLALVMRNTLSFGRNTGIKTAFSHALGVGIWALLSISGVALLMINTPNLFNLVKLAGGLFLLYLGWKTWCSVKQTTKIEAGIVQQPSPSPWSDGFMMALLSPKIALFFIALFSQFVSAENGLTSQIIIFATVAGVDFLWYLLIACVIGQPKVVRYLEQQQKLITVSTALVLTLFAAYMVVDSGLLLLQAS